MADLVVTITRFVDDHQPGWVECEFTDVDGQVHRFVEKAPVVSAQTLTAASSYPRPGLVSCRIEAEWGDQSGLDFVRVALDLAGKDDETSYVVLASDLG